MKYEERHAQLLDSLKKNVEAKNWHGVITFAIELRVLEGQAMALKMIQKQKVKSPNEAELQPEV